MTIVDDLRKLERLHEGTVTYRLARTYKDAADEIEGLRQAIADVGGWAKFGRDDKAVEILKKIDKICGAALKTETQS